ncbi:MAG: hypothetical protein MZU79_01815 [Anaerotruncus sp.]|nr:hypothetical protein [Anaerotruncus sp.]
MDDLGKGGTVPLVVSCHYHTVGPRAVVMDPFEGGQPVKVFLKFGRRRTPEAGKPGSPELWPPRER